MSRKVRSYTFDELIRRARYMLENNVNVKQFFELRTELCRRTAIIDKHLLKKYLFLDDLEIVRVMPEIDNLELTINSRIRKELKANRKFLSVYVNELDRRYIPNAYSTPVNECGTLIEEENKNETN